jgi:hypothetical protein
MKRIGLTPWELSECLFDGDNLRLPQVSCQENRELTKKWIVECPVNYLRKEKKGSHCGRPAKHYCKNN